MTVDCTGNITSEADEEVINFGEWQRLAQAAGIPVPPTAETDPAAFLVANRLLRIMRERGLAGSQAAVCTLGSRGVVAADWRKRVIYVMLLELLNGNPGVPTPAGGGEVFLARFMYLRRHWARNGNLRHPIAAASLRAMHQVADVLGLRRDQYVIRMTWQSL